jgi:hypothetical protein
MIRPHDGPDRSGGAGGNPRKGKLSRRAAGKGRLFRRRECPAQSRRGRIDQPAKIMYGQKFGQMHF